MRSWDKKLHLVTRLHEPPFLELHAPPTGQQAMLHIARGKKKQNKKRGLWQSRLSSTNCSGKARIIEATHRQGSDKLDTKSDKVANVPHRPSDNVAPILWGEFSDCVALES